MYEINTIADLGQLDAKQQVELLRALKVKKRLQAFLLARAKLRDFEPYERRCEYCSEGIRRVKPRDFTGIHPSSMEGCIKALWYAAADHYYEDCSFTKQMVNKHDSRMQLLFDWGTAMHNTLQGYGEDGAWGKPEDYHKEIVVSPESSPVAAELWVKGHADARVDNYVVEDVPTVGTVSVRMIHEYKSMREDAFRALHTPKPAHRWQATLYGGILDVPIVLYLYASKDTSQLQDFPVPFEPKLWDQIVTKIERVQHLVQRWALPKWEETAYKEDPFSCKTCPYQKICKPPMPKKPKQTSFRGFR